MIVFKQISLKNFLSFGNVPTTLRLNSHPSTLIIGRNGSGKSSINCDGVCYALFGKPYRNINKPQLVNSINQKNCLVELELDVNGIPYKIIRGMRPGVFEIYCDGKLLNQDAAIKDMQEYLETNIIKLNFRTFCQVVILGSAGFTPFMKLPAQSRREVVEDVLDIGIFSKMNGILKERVAATKEELHVIAAYIIGAKKETEAQKRIIEIIQKNQTTKVQELTGEIEHLTLEQTAAIKHHRTLTDELSSLDYATHELNKIKRNELTNSIQNSRLEIDRLTRKLKEITSLNKCPACLQGIEHDHKDSIQQTFTSDIENLSADVDRFLLEYNPCVEQVQLFDSKVSALNKSIDQYKGEIARLKSAILVKQQQIEKIEADTGDIETETLKLKEIASKAISLIQREKELKEEKRLQDISLVLLKDGGIKTAIIKEYLPTLNSIINKYLSMFDFFVNFNLDESFNEVIKSRGRDEFSYASFSEGEKKRLDLAILLAFRHIAAMKNSAKINLLIMDEVVDSSLDLEARAKFSELINTMTDSNIFVISHTDTSPDAYSAVIQVEKHGDFSTYRYI